MDYLGKIGWLVLLLVQAAWPGNLLAGVDTADSCRVVEVDIRSVMGADDLGGAGLEEGIAAGLRYLAKQPADKIYNLCDRQVSSAELRATLKELRAFWQATGGGKEFARRASERFRLVAVKTEAKESRVTLTGYFEPMLEGSLTREEPFIYPLYPVPDDLVRRGSEVGRLEDGRLVPYWSRREIEEQGLLDGRELAYLNDPVEAFVLQVQGSGRVRLRDGSVRRLQYAAKNGRPYRSIGRYLVERGAMELNEVSLPAISAYLKEHPEEVAETLRYNESYVFFRWGDAAQGGPLGSLGEPLTPGRSVALDQECFPAGAVALLFGRKPKFNDHDEIIGWTGMQRLVFNQDSGSAIRGPARVDLFLGHGARARATAGVMKGRGRLYFLLRK